MYKNYNIYFSDLETIIIDNKHSVVVIYIVSNLYEKSFISLDSYMRYIFETKSESIIYFHNLGRFDSTLNWIINNNHISTIEIREGNNIVYQILLKDKKIYFRDSYLIIPLSLKDISETFCKEHNKMDFEY